jgi:hypothetical protein
MLNYISKNKTSVVLILNILNILVWANMEKISPSNHLLFSSFFTLVILVLIIVIFKFLS